MIFVPVPRRSARPSAVGLLLAAAALLLTACTAPPSATGSADRSPAVVRPAPHVGFDYQIGGPYPPPRGVRAVSRDRTAEPAKGLYNVCYVNAFQAQPDALDRWRRDDPGLLLRDDEDDLVIDEDWNEALFDISTAGRRARLAKIVGRWVEGCGADGFQAVELDNLDSYTRSDGLLDASDAVAFARLLTDRAHAAGLAAGQKNTAELLPERAAAGFDFAVAEECGSYDECGAYAKAYDDRVFAVEYRAADFARACRAYGGRISLVLRDVDVRPAGTKGYVRRTC
ncbi:endo alpha-1,4 polygalactosaminidase [Streptomyces sp. NPDC088785]|uniref:endo alpha-1,4 polygalactosaminidase n=1 Tax=Streptomyces sp. NPDC088785 TaxID=3365897 RepID=UPI003807A046